ncbi:MAG: RloB family protein [Bacteroidales bacterium]|nr:RloB family protein [Bacteroidales bacterium]
MARRPRTSKGRPTNPNFFIFCEGESERAFIDMLRTTYRRPVQLIPIKSKANITERTISSALKHFDTTPNDLSYLMFDLDVEGILEKMQRISTARHLLSSPCFEYWLLLHFEAHPTPISTSECLKRLAKFAPWYRKGALTAGQWAILAPTIDTAANRARSLAFPANPSTQIYRLLEDLEIVSKPISTKCK